MKQLFIKTIMLLFTVSTWGQIKINIDPSNIKLRNNNKETNSGSNGNSNGSSNAPKGNVFSNAKYDFQVNPDAPADINYGLKAGDFCVAIDSRTYLSRKRVYQVVDGGYAIIDRNATDWDLKNNANAIRYYASNSVYPDVDYDAFRNDTRMYEEYIQHYIQCFSEQSGISMDILTNYNKNYPQFILGDVKEAEMHKKKLTELFNIMSTKYASLPNFFTKFDDNPFVWYSIAKDRDNMIKCLLAKSGSGKFSTVLNFQIEEIQKEIEDAKNFNNGGDWFVNDEIVGHAVSPKARQEFFDRQGNFAEYKAFADMSGTNPNMPKDTLNYCLDQLKAQLKTALPKKKPGDYLFKYRDANMEAKMKAYLKNPGGLTTFKIGLKHEIWQIETNSSGIPKYRYRYGAMYVKNPSWDHGYCKVLYFTIKQDYAGGGTYGDTYVGSYSEEYFGCP